MKSALDFSCEASALIQSLCAANKLEPFAELITGPFSNIEWADPDLGEWLLPYHQNIGTDQASRRPTFRRLIMDWVESMTGPMFQHKVLDLYCGCGSLLQECSAYEVLNYCGVEINPVLVAAAHNKAPAGAVFHCDDALRFVASKNLSEFTVVLLFYECLNALGRTAATALLRQLDRRCTPGTWIFWDTRTSAHCIGVKYEIAARFPYPVEITSDIVIREFGYTPDLKFFGNRYIGLGRCPPRMVSLHSMLELYSQPELMNIIAAAGLQFVATDKLLEGRSTDVPECASNVFFAVRTRGQLG